MEHATMKNQSGRGTVRDRAKRVARRREKIAQAAADRDPADELHARLLIMEQSLICMARFLRRLERDLDGALSGREQRAQKRTEHAEELPAMAEPSEAIRAVPAPQAPRAPFESITKAMRKLSGG
jgi:hypothetical protein